MNKLALLLLKLAFLFAILATAAPVFAQSSGLPSRVTGTVGNCVKIGTNNIATDNGAVCGTGTGTSVSQNSGSAETSLAVTGFMPQVCSDTSASGTAQSCTVANSFTPQAGNCIVYKTTTANSGTGLTVNVDSLGAKSVAIAGSSGWTTTLVASNSIPANKPMNLCYDGTNWNASGTGFAASSSSGPTFKGYVSVPLSASVTSITTASLSGISVGDLLVVYCRSNTATTLTGGVTSSPAETWNAITHVSEGSTGDTQISWAIAGTAGGHTATCTQSAAGANMAAAFLDYSGTGTTLNTSASTTGIAGASYPFPSNTTYASGAITTSQRTLVVFCTAVSSAGSGFLGGWINGNAGTIRAADSASGIGAQSSSLACEDVTAPTAGSITGYTSYASSQHFANTIAAFNY